MKRFHYAIALFAFMFWGYPEASKVVGKYMVLLLEEIIVFITGYDYIDTFDSVAVTLMDALEKINLTYVGAACVAELGAWLIYMAANCLVRFKLKKATFVPKIKFPKKIKPSSLMIK